MSRKNQFYTIEAPKTEKEILRERLEADVQAFLNRGGKIRKVESTENKTFKEIEEQTKARKRREEKNLENTKARRSKPTAPTNQEDS